MSKSIVRLLDLIFSISAIIIFAPILVPIMIVLLLTGEHKIFFMQKRVGIKGKIFSVYKFATMLQNSSKMPGGNVTVKNDSRVLPFGKFLRFTKINELPQLFNVILGNMSLIGVRPVPMDIYKNYPKTLRQKVFSAKPGLSGMGSLIFRDEASILVNETNPNDFHKDVISPYKLECDLWYTDQIKISRYITLIIATVYSIIFNPNPLSLSNLFKLPSPPHSLINKWKEI
jgi:lipopolysaccharide/colanic/teichoic acid biosynthesis glycosyltransferase